MKKILSIAAVSIISSALLAVNTNASPGCSHSFESYAERLNCSGSCKINEKVRNTKTYEYDSILEELLKDCGVIYYDSCPILPDNSQKPESDSENPKPKHKSRLPKIRMLPNRNLKFRNKKPKQTVTAETRTVQIR